MCTTADYLINRTPSALLNGKTHFEMLYDHVPSYAQIKIFGCLSFVHDHSPPKDKFELGVNLVFTWDTLL